MELTSILITYLVGIPVVLLGFALSKDYGRVRYMAAYPIASLLWPYLVIMSLYHELNEIMVKRYV